MTRSEFAAVIREKYMLNESLDIRSRYEVYDALFHTGSKLIDHFSSHDCIMISVDLIPLYTNSGIKNFVFVTREVCALVSWVKDFFAFYKDLFSVLHDCECINDFITYLFLLFFAVLFSPFAYIVCIFHDLGEFPFRR